MASESISIKRLIVAAGVCLILVVASFEQWSGEPPSAEIGDKLGDRIIGTESQLGLARGKRTGSRSKRALPSSAGIGFFTAKLDGLIIPSFQVDTLTLEETVAELVRAAKENDPSGDGVRILVDERKIQAERPEAMLETLTLDETDIKLGPLLIKITEQLGVKYRIDPYGIVFVPRLDLAEAVFTRTYPWGASLVGYDKPMDVLRELGVAFRDGASAIISDDGSRLVVRNTQAELDRLDQYIDNIGPVQPERLSPAIRLDWIGNPDF